MEDLFQREQDILDEAVSYVEALSCETPCDTEKYALLVTEYRKLLKQLRRITKLSDRTAVSLNTSKQDLLDKIHYDPLTGIYNRRFMEESLTRLITSLSRSGNAWLSVLMIDIDFFKRYNDTYGHQAGDECLRVVAKTLGKCASRADDFVARYGGEEFIVVLPGVDERSARGIGADLLENVMACNIPHRNNDAAEIITVSIGITTGYVKNIQTLEAYIRRADEALYISKQTGRNKCTFLNFSEEENDFGYAGILQYDKT